MICILIHVFTNPIHCIRFISAFATGPYVGTKPQITLQKGTEGVIPCKIEDAVYAVYWSKGSTASTAKTIVMLDNHFNAGQRVGAGYDEGRFNISEDFSLVIEDVQVADEGRYFCEGSDSKTGRNFLNHSDVSVYGKCNGKGNTK